MKLKGGGGNMSRAYKCDLCKRFTETVYKIDGFDFKIGEYRDEFIGTHEKRHEVHEVCKDCYEKIMETVVSLYFNEN